MANARQQNGEKYPECPVQSLQNEEVAVTTILLPWQLRLRHTDAIRNVSKTGHRLRRREYHLPDVSLKVVAGRLTITNLHRETGRVTLARGILQVDGREVVAVVNVNGATLVIIVVPSSVPDQPRKRHHVTVQFTKCVRQCSSG